MADERKAYSRYIFNRGLATLWKGDPATPGALYRSIVLTSADFNSTAAVFQVLELEGAGNGVENGKFAGPQGEPNILFDQDFEGMDDAAKQFNVLVKEAESQGFKMMTFWDQIDFEEKLKASRA
ncbi:hypothetical protein [Granulicella sp. L60]|uniref:hypothetical protein n=1 Tax=Granulicella sp. L60 TaxID=1641866 RepID=UPI00131B5F1E|nr:hypothetical protein [Granulicella sp. L60]